MKFKAVFKVVASINILISFFMILPLIVSIIYKENWYSFLYSFLISITFSLIILLLTKEAEIKIRFKESCLIVTLTWLLASLFGSLPYLFSGVFDSFTNAYFETMSGFTTTGASVMEVIEDKPYGILFWRSLSQWLGGIGVVILYVVIFPILGIGGTQLFKAEAPGVSLEKLSPKIKDTAQIIWKVYLLLTGLEILLLVLGGMPIYEAICHSFSTLSTGGFSPKNTSIEFYNSLYFELVILVFMILGGINFGVYYRILKKDFNSINNDKELKTYIGIIFVASFLIAINLFINNLYPSFFTNLRYSLFQVVSQMSTTGFASINWEGWPNFSLLVIITVMFIGGMSGSTGGGMKVIRVMSIIKNIFLEIYKLIHPQAVVSSKSDGILPKDINREIWAFFSLYMLLILIGTLILVALGIDMATSFSAALTTLSNVGPGLNLIGAAHNFNFIPDIGKWLLIFLMLVGRLELYTVLVLFSSSFWKK